MSTFIIIKFLKVVIETRYAPIDRLKIQALGFKRLTKPHARAYGVNNDGRARVLSNGGVYLGLKLIDIGAVTK